MARSIESLPPLGQHIRKFRKENRYSLGQFSDSFGLSKAQVWELEGNPNANPRLTTMIALAKATRTTLSRIATLAAAPHVAADQNKGSGNG